MDTAAIWGAVAGVIVLALGAVGLGLKKYIGEFFDDLIARRRRGSLAGGIRKLRRFHEALDRVQNLDFVDRVLVFRGRDSGGLPDPKRPFYIECLTGRDGKGVASGDHYAFELKVDTHFCRVLEEMVANERVDLVVETLPEGQLKTIHAAEGVKHAVKYFLTVDSNELLFLSVAALARPFTPLELGQLALAIEGVRSAIRS